MASFAVNPSPFPWILRTSILLPSPSASSLKHQLCPSVHRVTCLGGSNPSHAASDFKFLLHDSLESAGIDTSHAREAREGFCAEIKNLSDIERGTSISISRGVSLGTIALHIAAEDDSLVSHSSVPLPVDAFIGRLDDLCIGYCSHYNASYNSAPEHFLENLEKFLFVKKGFRRSSSGDLIDARALYLHTVLTHRSGSAVILSLIMSEVLKMLRIWGLLNFDVEIFFPHDHSGYPRLYNKQRSKESDQPHILTVQTLLEEILRDLKGAFWPFQQTHSKSLFLRAAHAANCIDKSGTGGESGFQLASAKAAQHRLDRGVWTTVRLGDMRRALSACERLILLKADPKELRDYSILLYHCGLYEQSLQFLELYQEAKDDGSSSEETVSDPLSSMEEDAEEKLMIRLKLILMEEGWSQSHPTNVRNFFGNNSDPW